MLSCGAQQSMMRKAYENAGLSPGETDYVEAHGTGTEVGDAIEAEAIASVFSRGRDIGKPLIVGSIKTNIGHTESTAGLAGLIKTILMLEKSKILPNHDFKQLSKRLPVHNGQIQVGWNHLLPLAATDCKVGTKHCVAMAFHRYPSSFCEHFRLWWNERGWSSSLIYLFSFQTSCKLSGSSLKVIPYTIPRRFHRDPISSYAKFATM